MFVRNWMSAPAVSIPPVVPAEAALGFMEKRQIRRLPVVEKGALVGIVTRSDLQAALGRGKGRLRNYEVGTVQVMTRNPVTVEPGETLERAAQMMLQKKISGLPVVNEGKLVGIITESDVFRALCEMMGIGEKGARIVMSIDDGDDFFKEVERRMNGLALRSLATCHNVEKGRWEVVARVRGRVPARVPSGE